MSKFGTPIRGTVSNVTSLGVASRGAENGKTPRCAHVTLHLQNGAAAIRGEHTPSLGQLRPAAAVVFDCFKSTQSSVLDMRVLLRPSLLQNQRCAIIQRRFLSADVSPIVVQHHPAPHSGGIRVLLLDRPANRNALSRRLLTDLRKHVQHIQDEGGVGGTRALIIASNNDNAFCAGADLKERKGMTQDE